MKAYITKYALTTGINKVEAEVCGNRMIKYRLPRTYDLYAHGNDWHETKEDTIFRCEEMRTAKIKSLKKQIAKIEALDFESMVRKAGE